jgi:hypothetical protein
VLQRWLAAGVFDDPHAEFMIVEHQVGCNGSCDAHDAEPRMTRTVMNCQAFLLHVYIPALEIYQAEIL